MMRISKVLLIVREQHLSFWSLKREPFRSTQLASLRDAWVASERCLITENSSIFWVKSPFLWLFLSACGHLLLSLILISISKPIYLDHKLANFFSLKEKGMTIRLASLANGLAAPERERFKKESNEESRLNRFGDCFVQSNFSWPKFGNLVA